MTSTEAYETVIFAARMIAGGRTKVYIGPGMRDLVRALKMVEKKVARMRARLDKQRAKRARDETTAKGMPAWLERATR